MAKKARIRSNNKMGLNPRLDDVVTWCTPFRTVNITARVLPHWKPHKTTSILSIFTRISRINCCFSDCFDPFVPNRIRNVLFWTRYAVVIVKRATILHYPLNYSTGNVCSGTVLPESWTTLRLTCFVAWVTFINLQHLFIAISLSKPFRTSHIAFLQN